MTGARVIYIVRRVRRGCSALGGGILRGVGGVGRFLLLLLGVVLLPAGCERQPILHLCDHGDPDLELRWVNLDLDVVWDYSITSNWRDEWLYGWDKQDSIIFGGPIGYREPTEFELRRYYKGDDSLALHTQVQEHYLTEPRLRTSYNVGYYDVLAWNDVYTPDGVRSVLFDESTSLDYVTATTNTTMESSPYKSYNVKTRSSHTYYQPEDLFSGYMQNMYISNNPADYDYYDEATHTYYKKVDMSLMPVTYIYLTQLILHHNRGRVTATDGNSRFSGMAKSTTLNTGVNGVEDIVVSYYNRMKTNIKAKDNTLVDIIGGRFSTFGIPEMNPMRAAAVPGNTKVRNYMDYHLQFSNGMDSTLVFDVTDQVRKKYRGGVITVELDMDTVKIPSTHGGSGFDAVVEDPDEVTKEFEM
jgi:hypothetical protein